MALMPETVLTKEQEQFARLALELGETLEFVWNMVPQERWEQSSYVLVSRFGRPVGNSSSEGTLSVMNGEGTEILVSFIGFGEVQI